ncbi:MAG: hypothetical protein AB1657_01465 [Candidatus Micrarchaeota archaeon]
MPRAVAPLAAAAAAVSLAHAKPSAAAPAWPAREEKREAIPAAKRVAERPGTPREGREIIFTHGPRISSASGDLTTSISLVSNPLPRTAAERDRTFARIEVVFETQDGIRKAIYVDAPTTWRAGQPKDIISDRDSRYAFLIFEKCVVVAPGLSSVLQGGEEAPLTVERNGESAQLPSNSFHFFLPEDSQGENLFTYAASGSGFAFLNRGGALRISPVDVEGNFLRTDVGAPEPGTRLFFERGLLFVVRPAENCITAFDSQLNSSPFSTGEQLSGSPAVTATETGFEVTFPTESGGLARYKAVVQSEGNLSSFIAMQIEE